MGAGLEVSGNAEIVYNLHLAGAMSCYGSDCVAFNLGSEFHMMAFGLSVLGFRQRSGCRMQANVRVWQRQ